MTVITALNGALPADELVDADTGPNGPQQAPRRRRVSSMAYCPTHKDLVSAL